MPTSAEAITRSRIATIAATVTGFTAGRIKLGIVDLSASSETWQTIVADGAYLVILPAESPGLGNPEGTRAEFRVRMKVYFGITADAAYDFTAIEDIVFALRNALALKSNWTDASAPEDIVVLPPRPKKNLKPLVYMYELQAAFMACTA